MKKELEQKYAKYELSIVAMEDYSDVVEFKYFNTDKNKIVKSKLFVDLGEMSPEEKLEDFFKSIQVVEARETGTFNSYTNAQRLLAMNPDFDIPAWDIISDEEVEFFKNFKREEVSFTKTKVSEKYSNWSFSDTNVQEEFAN